MQALRHAPDLVVAAAVLTKRLTVSLCRQTLLVASAKPEPSTPGQMVARRPSWGLQVTRARRSHALSQLGKGWQHHVLTLAAGAAVLTASLVTLPGPAASASGAGVVIYVANNGDSTVTTYNTRTDTVATIPVGDAPYRLAVTPDGAAVYVANSGSIRSR
jgi:YVTN family beta-propeller protein